MAVEAGPSREDTPEATGGRGPTIRFITVFVAVILFLLTGYRYAINTRLNDWYLFQVAQHTSWVLGKVGHSSALESGLRTGPSPREVRASLNAWKQGRETPTAEEVAAASPAPLTPWERWSYRAHHTRQATQGGLHGPYVSFDLQPGITQQLRQAYAELEMLETDSALSADKRAAKRAKLQQKIEALQSRHRELMETRSGRAHPERGKFFDFYVVSECGAIEVMAIFLAAILAFPTRWWKRFVGLLLGLPIMYAINIFRLSCLGVIGALTAGGRIFHFSHHYVWQAIYIIFVVVVWLTWLEFLVNREPRIPPFFRSMFAPGARIRRVAIFGVRFAISIVVCAVLWWWFLPVYGRALLAISMWILRWSTSLLIDGGRIEPHGLLNTETRLIFEMAGREPALPIALLVTNIPPYIALVLATAGLRFWRRLRILAYGCGILMAGHVTFIVVVLRYQSELQRASEIPIAIIQFFLTLPVLLWIVFAYWDQMMRYLAAQEGRGGQPPDIHGAPESGPESTAPNGTEASPSFDATPGETARRTPVSPTCVLPGQPIDFQKNSDKSGEDKDGTA